MSCSWLFWEEIGYQLHSICSVFRTVLTALAGFAEGAEQSTAVAKGCEEFLCTTLCPGLLYITHAKKGLVVLFKLLRHEQGFNKLPRTHGAWLEHTRREHVQANV